MSEQSAARALFGTDTEPLRPDEALTHCMRRLANGAKRQTVRDDLLARGTPPEEAAVIAEKAFILKTTAFRKKGWETLGIGAAIGIGGLAFTLATYSAAEGGGIYVVAYGAIISGFVGAARGAWLVITNQPVG